MNPALTRCPWCLSTELYIHYHDQEWGVPCYDDIKQFEFLVLESAQAGLSWLTILKRRESYQKAYDNFDPVKVAAYNEQDINRLLNDSGIIRNRKKIEASVNNARRFLELQACYGSFSCYLLELIGGKPINNHWQTLADIPPFTPLSDKISKELKKNGFQFLGSTIIYSHLQATGMVNDHLISCFRYEAVKKMQR